MARCNDCIHENVCFALIEKGLPWNDRIYPAEAFCLAFRNKADVVLREDVIKALGPTISALFMIRETLVDVSKWDIDEKKALDDIRKYMSKAICTRYRLEQTLAELKKKYTEKE